MYHPEICPESGQELIISNELTATNIYCEYLTMDKKYSYNYSNGYLFNRKENKKYHICNDKWQEFVCVFGMNYFYSWKEYNKYIENKINNEKLLASEAKMPLGPVTTKIADTNCPGFEPTPFRLVSNELIKVQPMDFNPNESIAKLFDMTYDKSINTKLIINDEPDIDYSVELIKPKKVSLLEKIKNWFFK